VRYLYEFIKEDLTARKMVFIGGPRQAGKTTLALGFLKNGNEEHPAYLNWDHTRAKNMLLSGELPPNEPIIIFDEIHKYHDWRNLVKGIYDIEKNRRQFIVTGSARLDYYSRGGDSLQGRIFYYRLHPATYNELPLLPLKKGDLDIMIRYGGFPEPLLEQDDVFWRRWQRERKKRVINEDLLSLEQVREISKLDLLVDLLPARVGSPLSIQKIRQELKVAHETVEKWISILENLYYCYRIPPYGADKIKAVKKEQKLYLWDWSLCLQRGQLLENMVASHLLKFCHFREDTLGHEMELRYLRDIEKREIDFVVLQDKKPLFAVECKAGERETSPHIKYFAQRTTIPVFYQVHFGAKNAENLANRTRILPFSKFCQELKLP